MAPDNVPVYSGNEATCSGSTIAPDWTPVYSGKGATCSGATKLEATGFSLGVSSFLVPFSTILGVASSIFLVERTSLETSALSTVKIRTTSILRPGFPSCFTLTVPSGKSGFSCICSPKAISVSTVSSLYNNSGLATRPDKTSS